MQAVQRRIDLLQRETLPALETADEAELTRLRDVIRDDLTIMEADIEDMELAAEDCLLDSDRLAALENVRLCKESVEQIRARVRQATLGAKRRFGSSRLSSQRQRLLGDPASQRSTNAPKGSGEDELMNATSDVTASLQRTMQLMQQELDRSLLSNQLLEQSTGTMNLATEQHVNFTSLLSASKHLITSMERADVIDRLLIFGALIFFALVCLYILKRRIVDKGLRAASVVGSLVPRRASTTATQVLSAVSTEPTTPWSALETSETTSLAAVRSLHYADEL